MKESIENLWTFFGLFFAWKSSIFISDSLKHTDLSLRHLFSWWKCSQTGILVSRHMIYLCTGPQFNAWILIKNFRSEGERDRYFQPTHAVVDKILAFLKAEKAYTEKLSDGFGYFVMNVIKSIFKIFIFFIYIILY